MVLRFHGKLVAAHGDLQSEPTLVADYMASTEGCLPCSLGLVTSFVQWPGLPELID